jgi:hypothetical protein
MQQRVHPLARWLKIGSTNTYLKGLNAVSGQSPRTRAIPCVSLNGIVPACQGNHH